MTSQASDIAAIVAAHNAPVNLAACLSSLHDHARECREVRLTVIVADSGSAGSAEVARASGGSAIACASSGHGAGTNVGRRAISAAPHSAPQRGHTDRGGAMDVFAAYAEANYSIAAVARRIVDTNGAPANGAPVSAIAPFEGVACRLADRLLARSMTSRYNRWSWRRPFGCAPGASYCCGWGASMRSAGSTSDSSSTSRSEVFSWSMRAQGLQREPYRELMVRHDRIQRRLALGFQAARLSRSDYL
jgi:hypothetical protein